MKVAQQQLRPQVHTGLQNCPAGQGPPKVKLPRRKLRPVHPEDGLGLRFPEGALLCQQRPEPLPCPCPSAPAQTPRSLTIAVKELEPVVNPVIGLFAVGFLVCSRTQRHRGSRRELL